MLDDEPEYTYSVQVGKMLHRYVLTGRCLKYRCSGSDVTWSFDLERDGFTLKKRFVTRPLFRAGLVLILIPLFTLGIVYIKDGVILASGGWEWVHLAIMVVGAVLVTIFRCIDRAWHLQARSGDGLLIFRDPARPNETEQFVTAVRRLWYDGGMYVHLP